MSGNHKAGSSVAFHELVHLPRKRTQPKEDREALALIICPIPDPLDTADQAARANHWDLAHMDDRRLWVEKECVQHALALIEPPHPWHLERYDRICAEEARRGGRAA